LISTKLVIFNTLSYYIPNVFHYFSCKRLHFEQDMITTTTNRYDLPTSPCPPPNDTSYIESKEYTFNHHQCLVMKI